jgi:hypothetical protein
MSAAEEEDEEQVINFHLLPSYQYTIAINLPVLALLYLSSLLQSLF